MRYLALIWDSLREATDNKILYFTIGIWLLVIGFLATIYFHPMAVQDQVDAVVESANSVFAAQSQLRAEKPKCKSVEVTQLNDASQPWLGDYKVVVSLYLPPSMAGSAEGFQNRFIVEAFLRQRLWWMDDLNMAVKTKEVGAPGGGKEKAKVIYYIITHHGTKVDNARSWDHDPRPLFGLISLASIPMVGVAFISPLDYSVFWIQYAIATNIGGWGIVLISIVVTAGFVPSIMQKGAAELLLSKPLSRPLLLFFKYLGGSWFTFVNAAILVGGVWLALGLRSGIWHPAFLITPFIITFYFSVFYALSTSLAVVARNALVPIFITLLFWALLLGMSIAYGQLHPGSRTRPVMTDDGRIVEKVEPPPPTSPSTFVRIFDTAYTILPRFTDLSTVTSQVLIEQVFTERQRKAFGFKPERQVNVRQRLGVGAGFIAVFVALACWRFSRYDF